MNLLTRSVRSQAMIGATAVVALALLIGGWFLLVEQRATLLAGVESTANLRADDLVAALQAGALPQSIPVRFEDASFVQILYSGRVVRSSPNIEGEQRIADFSPGPGGTQRRILSGLPIGDVPFVVVVRRVDVAEADILIYVGQSTELVRQGSRTLLGSLAAVIPLVLLLVGLVARRVAGHALRQVDSIRTEVQSITDRELHRRVPDPGGSHEVALLARTMNDMLDRLEDSVTRQQQFVADASHELRSPLTAMRAQLETELAHPAQADWVSTGSDLLADAVRLQRLVEDLLTAARADRGDPELRLRPVDLDDVVLREVRRLRLRGACEVDASDVRAVQVQADGDGLACVVRNLLDNAERHARQKVSVSLVEHAHEAVLIVSDDGPGVPVGEQDRIFERFARSDIARGRDTGGAGLGLAIARAIAAAHGGSLTVLPGRPGGTFRLCVPGLTAD